MKDYEYDVAVIGGGSGGYAAARTAADADLRAVVIEGGREVGGLCILRGCMPTKALLYAAEVKHLAEHPQVWGIHSQGITFDFSKVMARKNSIIKEFADYRAQQLVDATFQFIRANAHFVDAHTLALSNGQRLTARSFVIATGSVSAPSPYPFLDHIGYLTSDEALMLPKLPKSLVILGGGAVAVELAHFFSRFDVKTTVIQRSSRLLQDFDADATDELEKVLRRNGVKIFTNTQPTGARKASMINAISFLHDAHEVHVDAEDVLFALGRVPNTRFLHLDKGRSCHRWLGA